jgi:hypothetical protein
MKLLPYLIILFLITACFPIDPIPVIHIKFEKSIINDIDSIILLDSQQSSDTKEINKKKLRIK